MRTAMADARQGLVLVAALAGFAERLAAQDEPPDLSFLEYLGSWAEGDDEWIVIAGIEAEADESDQTDEHDEASAADEKKDEKLEQD